jgi:hypothetical protein
VGIATAFLVGGAMADSSAGLGSYFNLITVAAFVVSAGALLQFRERPPTPPTGSAKARLERKDDEDENFLVTARKLLSTPGFLPPLCAFVGSSAPSACSTRDARPRCRRRTTALPSSCDRAAVAVARDDAPV